MIHAAPITALYWIHKMILVTTTEGRILTSFGYVEKGGYPPQIQNSSQYVVIEVTTLFLHQGLIP